MNFATQIAPASVVPFAMKLVKGAEREIFMTMNMIEENNQPLPMTYHRLIETKAESGITVIRYGYGPKKVFRQFSETYTYLNFCYGGSISRYQRMLLVDKHSGLFRLNDRIYYTTVTALVSALRVYAEGTV